MYNGQQRARRQQAFESQALEVPMDEYDAYGLPSTPQIASQPSPRPSSNTGSGFFGKFRKFGGGANIEDDPDEFGAGTLPGDGQFPDLSIKDLNGIRDRHRYPTFDDAASSGDAASTNGRTMSLTSVGAFDTTPIIPTFGPGGMVTSNGKAKNQHLQYRQNMIDARRQLLSSDLGVQNPGQPRTHTMGNMRRPTMSNDTYSPQLPPPNGYPVQNSPRTMSLGNNPRNRGSRQNGPAFAPNMQLLPHHQHQQYASPGPHHPSQFGPAQPGQQGLYQAPGYHSQANFHAQGPPVNGQDPRGFQGHPQGQPQGYPQGQPQSQLQGHPPQSAQMYQSQPGVRSPLSHSTRGSQTFEKHPSSSGFSYESATANTPMDDKSTMTETSAADLAEHAANAAAAVQAAEAASRQPADRSSVQSRGMPQQRPKDIMFSESEQVAELMATNKQLQEDMRILSIELAESTRRELQLDPQNETANLAAELAAAQKELALERQKRMAAQGYGYVSENDLSMLELESRHAETTQLLEMRSHENEQLRAMAETAKRDVASLHDQNKDFQTQVRALQVTQGKGDVDELRRQVDMVQNENKKLQELLDQSVEQGSVAERLKRTEEQRDVLQSTVRSLRERKDQEVSMLQSRISQLETHMDLMRSAVPRSSSAASGGVSRSANQSFDTSVDTSADYGHQAPRDLTINTALANEAANLEPPRMRAHGRPASPLTLNFDLNYLPNGPTRVTSRTSPVPLALSGN